MTTGYNEFLAHDACKVLMGVDDAAYQQCFEANVKSLTDIGRITVDGQSMIDAGLVTIPAPTGYGVGSMLEAPEEEFAPPGPGIPVEETLPFGGRTGEEGPPAGFASWKEFNDALAAMAATPGAGVTTTPVPVGGEIPPTLEGVTGAMPIGQEFGPYTQYLQSLGLAGGGYQTPSQRYQARMYEPLRALYGLEQAYAPMMGTEPGYWGDYLGGYAGAPGAMYGRAGTLFSQLMSRTPGERAEAGYVYGPSYTEGGGAERMAPQQELVDLISMAMRPKWGAYGASRFAGRIPEEEQIWLGRQAGGETQPFFDWLRQKYKLGQYFAPSPVAA